jgi:hypothetical protein
MDREAAPVHDAKPTSSAAAMARNRYLICRWQLLWPALGMQVRNQQAAWDPRRKTEREM